MININQDRLWQSLMEMATIGATEKGGSSRLALSTLDYEGRNLFIKWCEAEGLEIKHDSIGNLFAHRVGKNNDRPPIVMGSHLDTQPKGGKYDGVYGVLSALEVIRTLNEHNIETENPLEIAVWTNEEGARFEPAMLGSALFIEAISLDDALAIEDSEGISVKDALADLKHPQTLPFKRPFNAYFEAHIEQGPILEAKELSIGIVTGGQAISWSDITIKGAAAHAGTTPMNMRFDPMFAVAEILQEMEEKLSTFDQGLLTVGELNIHQQTSRNTIPDAITFSLDLRHPEVKEVKAMEAVVNEIVNRVGLKRHLATEITPVWLSPAIPFDQQCIQLVEDAVEKLGYSGQRMISGAGHDAVNIAKFCPATMIFIPCVGGISHNEAEEISSDDASKGANVLLHAVLGRDKE